MNKREIRESGLLEQYAMGVLTDQEVREVEGYLAQFPELQKDYLEIQNSLQALATERSIKPRATLEDEIIKSIIDKSQVSDSDTNTQKNDPHKGGTNIWKIISGLIAIGAISAFYMFWDANKRIAEQTDSFNNYKLTCDSITRSQQEALDLFNKLNDKENRILNITPTDGYPDTKLLFHFNPIQKQNYIQVQNLPAIASNQAFQLWSLKSGVDPIPLTVFKSGNNFIVPVDFEEGTGTYAITIEAEAGAAVPTLERLIGTVTV